MKARFVFLGASVALADQILKFTVFYFEFESRFFFGFTNYINRGFAFGLPLPSFLIIPLIILTLSVFSWLALLQWTKTTIPGRAGMVLVLSGGLVNFIERLLMGYVRDPIKIFHGYWNLADFAIIIGLALWLAGGKKNNRGTL